MPLNAFYTLQNNPSIEARFLLDKVPENVSAPQWSCCKPGTRKECFCFAVMNYTLLIYKYPFYNCIALSSSNFPIFFINIFISEKVCSKLRQKCQINPFVPNIPFLYPLKTSENLKVGRERVRWEQMD